MCKEMFYKMKIRTLSIAAVCAFATMAPACASAQSDGSVTVNFAVEPGTKTLTVNHISIPELMATPRRQTPNFKSETVNIKDLSATFPLEIKEGEQYRVALTGNPADDVISFFAAPGDNLTVSVESVQPLVYSVTGSALMDGISEIDTRVMPIQEKAALIQNGTMAESEYPALEREYGAILTEYVRENPKSPASVYALLSMPDDQFETALAMLAPEAKESILYPFLENTIEGFNRRQEQEKRQREMSSGTVTAPDFTLQNMEGKEVSLKDFRGKWVVLDFWGSWCGWCIKGMPKMKEAYAQYKGKLEIIGVDCGDSEADWKAAVERLQLPWVHVYNPRGNDKIQMDYGVQGYPTKVIINPEGKIADIITGEDPAFYTTLARLIK